MKIVVTIVGRDRIGIVAMVSSFLAEHSVNVTDISQNIMNDFFNMVMIADMSRATIPLRDLQEMLKKKGEDMGLEIKAQHEEIFKTMHRV